jgi:hypothetical protein
VKIATEGGYGRPSHAALHVGRPVDAPAGEVLARINPTVGVVETVDDHRCVLVTGADSLEIVAVWIGMLGLDFHMTDPPELIEHVRALADRYRRALPVASRAEPSPPGRPSPRRQPGSTPNL